MNGRKLIIVDINDQVVRTFVGGEGGARHFEVHQIESWAQVQSILSGRDFVPPPDLLLVDVSFDWDIDLSGAGIEGRIPPGDGIVPVGPILALPFLNSRPVMAFAPYSAHLDHPGLIQYPPFLVAMGLIAAKMQGGKYSSKHLSFERSDGSLDKFIRILKHAGNPIDGLDTALPDYRTNLSQAIKEERVSINNGQQLVSQFREVRSKFDDAKLHESTNVRRFKIPEDSYLEVLDVQRGSKDRISLLSLFADQVEWAGKSIDSAGNAEILKWLEEWVGSEPCYEKAIRAIQEQSEQAIRDPRNGRKRIDDVINKLFNHMIEAERREVLRLCVLFANVHAWCVNTERTFLKEDVYERLGEKLEQHTYLSWFGVTRSRKVKVVKSKLSKPRKRSNLSVAPLSPFHLIDHDDIDDYFLTEGSSISEHDDKLVDLYISTFDKDEKYSEKGFRTWIKPYTVLA
jgi:hypothetical protein